MRNNRFAAKMNLVAPGDDREAYVVVYDREHIVDAKQTLGRWASDPQLSFDWKCADALAKRITRLQRE